MNRHSVFRWGLIILTLIVLYLAYVVVKPFLVTIIFALMMAFMLHPVHTFFSKKLSSNKSSAAVIILVLLLLIIPSAYLVTKLVSETTSAYRSFLDSEIDIGSLPLIGSLPFFSQGNDVLDGAISGAKDYIVSSAPNLLGEVASVFLHLFLFLFILYFANIQGMQWYKVIKDVLPLRAEVRSHLFTDLERVTSALVYGQFLTAVIQGAAGGLMFFIFGIDNAIFWGFVMILFSLIPFLGTPIIFIPAGLISLAMGNYVTGIGVLVVGFVVIMNLDNLVRPYLVSKFAPIHPLIVVIGVFGGLKAFGFAGMILGPLILAILFTLAKDIVKHKDLLAE